MTIDHMNKIRKKCFRFVERIFAKNTNLSNGINVLLLIVLVSLISIAQQTTKSH